ncbi:helix-turn-helix transcriptional regulator [Pontibacter actiniarum]|uniref:Transcriptional regulator n=1 Tax=Pontibacter actiniarum TaxID=323450 RepID=A0A1X9YRY3_9BACT|nr:helix-turn-helix transcriptional regulator [Pontibacter actiniarum]ARS35635.1 transcriptional regulator [Pontibacter actiniarum]
MNNGIKVERARHNMSQSDLADKLGVSRQTIYAIENKKFVPSTVLALKLALIFDVRVEELFQLEDSD